MGFLDKVKNMFTEEIEETPIKKEVMHVEIPSPTAPQQNVQTVEPKVEPVKPQVSESEVLVKEEKPQAPVFFDDKDFATLERVEKREEKKVKKLEDKYKGKEEEKKNFHPTPIISPVYGVLDKNYHKEDITPRKNNQTKTSYEKAELTIDEVRRKAYGTLEDDLETVIPGEDYELVEESSIIDHVDDEAQILEDLMDVDYQPRFAKKHNEEDVLDMSDDIMFPEEESKFESEEKDMFEELHEENTNEDVLENGDLFNLIDSMYEKRDDE